MRGKFDIIDDATGFANGELLESAAEVREYFSPTEQFEMFGEEAVREASTLAAWADLVIARGWHARTLAIRNTSGQWWTGECWGVEQARKRYSYDELPDLIDLDNVGDEVALRCDPLGTDPADTLYYPDVDADDDEDTHLEPVASVVVIY